MSDVFILKTPLMDDVGVFSQLIEVYFDKNSDVNGSYVDTKLRLYQCRHLHCSTVGEIGIFLPWLT
jgi:hypothetical protein